MSRKAKGSNAERELIHLFWKHDWAALRSAGSGSNKYPCPDVIASNNVRKIAIECKATAAIKQYLSKKQVEELRFFANKFGCESWIGVRFDKLAWYFLMLEDIQETEGENFVISIELAKRKGLSFEELIGISSTQSI